MIVYTLSQFHVTSYTQRPTGMFFSIDATTSDCTARYVNDTPTNTSNCVMKKVVYQQEVRLCLFSNRDINPGDELRYDYGGDSSSLYWRSVSK